jgi:retron-type reverse transcriptase
MVHLIQDPKGETVMDPSTAADAVMSIQSKPTSVAGPPSQDDVSKLKQRILELERKLQGSYNIVMIARKFLYHSGCTILIFQIVHCEQYSQEFTIKHVASCYDYSSVISWFNSLSVDC